MIKEIAGPFPKSYCNLSLFTSSRATGIFLIVTNLSTVMDPELP